MEFVALGVLGILGYVSAPANSKSTPTKAKEPTINGVILEKEFRQNVANHMVDDTTVVNHNFIPFFKSEKYQNTNDDLKDRRLGTFTGVNNVDYHKKQEVEAIQPVKNLTNVNGTTFQPDFERYKEYASCMGSHNNVSPIEKQYIGPGLGIDPAVSADGGFHQEFRILPDNVNGYRKNTFGAEIVPGKSNINNRESDQFVDTKNIIGSNLSAEEQAKLGHRPFDAAHGSVGAHSIRYDANASLHNNNRSLEGMCDPGTLSGVEGTYQFGDTTRQTDRLFSCNDNNIGGAFRGLNAGYNNTQFFTTETERETVNNHRSNLHGNQIASYTYGQTDTHTLRENEACPSQQYGGAHPTDFSAGTSRDGWYAPPTQKQQVLSNPHLGIAGSGVSNAHTVVDAQLNRSTMRGNGCGEMAIHGPASAYVSGFQTTYTQSAPNASRELATVTNYTHNGQKPNLMLGAQQMAHTVTSQRQDENTNRICSNPQGLGTQTHTQQIGSVYAYGQKTVENDRDFGYTPQNPLVTNILKKQ